jgi:hypothetical protein
MAASNFSMQCGRFWQRSSSGRCSAEPRHLRSELCRPPCIRSTRRYISGEPSEFECGTMSDEGRPACEIHRDENGDVFVLVGGTKIAKRGLSDTPQADTWIMFEPGWGVRDVKGGKAIEVSYEHSRMH